VYGEEIQHASGGQWRGVWRSGLIGYIAMICLRRMEGVRGEGKVGEETE
jgi:hypothetical protein